MWATLLAFCVAVFIGLAPWYVLGPLVATEQYGGLAVYGVVAATFGAGTIVGSLIGIRWRPLHPMRMAMALRLPAADRRRSSSRPASADLLVYPPC